MRLFLANLSILLSDALLILSPIILSKESIVLYNLIAVSLVKVMVFHGISFAYSADSCKSSFGVFLGADVFLSIDVHIKW
jgi:hypothetical protein